MSDVLDRPIRIMYTMDRGGHTSFGWDAEDDDWVLPMIQKKMDEGYVFWIIERRPLREVELRRIQDIGNNRHLFVHDDASRELFEQGHIGLIEDDPRHDIHTVRPADNAREAVANDTLAHRPHTGG